MFLLEIAIYCFLSVFLLVFVFFQILGWVIDSIVLLIQSVVYGSRWAFLGKPKPERQGFWIWYNNVIVPLSRFTNWLSLRSKRIKMRFKKH